MIQYVQMILFQHTRATKRGLYCSPVRKTFGIKSSVVDLLGGTCADLLHPIIEMGSVPRQGLNQRQNSRQTHGNNAQTYGH